MAKPAYKYVTATIDRKAKYSNAVRIEQMKVLVNNMNSGALTLLFGQGLGNTISERTAFRDYTEKHSYELQPLYILNQVGLVYFVLFVCFNIILTLKFIKYKKLILIYFSYVLYASFNPYIFDTSHIVVIIVLISLKKVSDGKYSLCDSCSVQS